MVYVVWGLKYWLNVLNILILSVYKFDLLYFCFIECMLFICMYMYVFLSYSEERK